MKEMEDTDGVGNGDGNRWSERNGNGFDRYLRAKGLEIWTDSQWKR